MKKQLKIFISSPGDVGQERLISARVFERLQGEFANFFDLDVILWEHEPLRSTGHYQDELIRPSDTDLMILILWSRLGTRLPEKFKKADGSSYASGTEWEFEDALEGFKANGKPEIMTYRKSQIAVHAIHDESALLERLRQKKALDSFCDNWFGNAEKGFQNAYHMFETPDQFEEILEIHLRRFLRDKLPAHVTDTGESTRITWSQGSPFRGLEPFDIEHAAVFFGRTREIAEIKQALQNRAAQDCAFVMILGMSGGGKSSLARAGVLATIVQPGVVEGVGLWRWAIMRPSDAGAGNLIRSLSFALLSKPALHELLGTGLDQNDLTKIMRESPASLVSSIKMGLKLAADDVQQKEKLSVAPVAKMALLIDQFEEVFTSDALSREEVELFIEIISTLAKSGLVWVIATMRSDFYHRAADYPLLIELKEGEGQYHLLPPDFHEIGQMIRHPARAAGLKFEVRQKDGARLDDLIHEAASKSPENLPLLEFVLDALFQERVDDDILTFEAYEKLGGIEGALARRAEEIYQKLPPDAQQELPFVFRSLVTLEKSDVLKPMARRILLENITSNEARRAFIDAFIRERLVISDQNDMGQSVVRIAHESLITHWPRIQEWLLEDAEFLRVRGRIVDAEAQWKSEGERDEYLLAPGKPLTDARDLLLRREDLESHLVIYIEKSNELFETTLREKEAEARRKLNLFRALSFVFAILSLVAVLGGYTGYRGQKAAQTAQKAAEKEAENAKNSQKEAEESATQARLSAKKADISSHASEIAKLRAELQFSRGLRNQSHFLADLAKRETEAGRIETSILLSLEALPKKEEHFERPYIVQAEAALYDALYNYRRKTDYEGLKTKITSLVMSHDLTRIAAASEVGNIQLWNTATPDENTRQISAHEGRITQLLFTKDGKTLISSGIDGTIKLWDTANATLMKSFEGHKASVEKMVLDPENLFLASISRDKTLRLWDLKKMEQKGLVQSHEDWITDLGFTPNGENIVTTGLDQKVRHWNITSNVSKILYQHSSPIHFLAIHPKEKRFVIAGNDGSILMVDSQTGQPTQLEGHYGSLTSLRISMDGNHLISASRDGTARLWTFNDPKLIKILSGHEGPVLQADFCQTNGFAATTGADGTFRLWRTDNGEQFMILDTGDLALNQLFIAPHGKSLLTGRGHGKVELWKISKIGEKMAIEAHQNRIYALSFDPKSDQFLSAGWDGFIRLWSSEKGKEIQSIKRDPQNIATALYSPKGEYFAIGLRNGDVELWENGGSQPRFTLIGHKGEVNSLAFSHDEKHIATGGDDHVIRIFDTHSGIETAQFVGHRGKIRKLIYTRDDDMLFSASNDSFVIKWNIAKNLEETRFKGHSGPINDMALNPEGTRLVTGSDDQTARLWNTKAGEELFLLSGHKGPIKRVDITKNAKFILTASTDQNIALWHAFNGRQLIRISKHLGNIENAFFSPDDARIISASSDGTARIWHIETGEEIAMLHKGNIPVLGANLNPKGNQIALTLADGKIQIVPIFSNTEAITNFAKSLVKKEFSPIERQRYFLGVF
jgi:WD40 repeat protein